MTIAKYDGFQRRSIFSTEGSVGCGLREGSSNYNGGGGDGGTLQRAVGEKNSDHPHPHISVVWCKNPLN